MRAPPTEIRKLIGFVVAIVIAAYAIYGIITDDLVMPYHWRDPVKHWGSVHFRGLWAIGGSVCLLLGAAGLVILSYGVIGANPKADPKARYYIKLATPLIFIGTLFFLGISYFAEFFVR